MDAKGKIVEIDMVTMTVISNWKMPRCVSPRPVSPGAPT